MRIQSTTALLLLVTGCGFGFESPGVVIDRRILAIQAEPPEVIVNNLQPITIRALVVEPSGTGLPLTHVWRSCQPDLAFSPFADKAAYDATKQRCKEDADNIIENGDSMTSDFATSFDLPPESVILAQAYGMSGNSSWTPVRLQLRVDGTKSPLYATKDVVVASPGPGDRLPNKNPHLTGLLFDDKPWNPGVPATVVWKQCAADQLEEIPDPKTGPKATVKVCHHRITPVFDPSQEEAYQVQLAKPADDGSTIISVKERLRFDWYTEVGSWTKEHTERPDSISPKETDPLSTKWVEPARLSTTTFRLWIVTSDGRGGVDWTERQVTLNAAP